MENPKESHLLAAKRNLRKSTSGYVFMLGFRAISWTSKKQEIITLSTIEAEYIVATTCVCQAIWIRRILEGLNFVQERKVDATVIYCDNSSTIKLSNNLVLHGRSKHKDLKFHFIQNLTKDEVIELHYCKIEDQVADIRINPLKVAAFQKLRALLGLSLDETFMVLLLGEWRKESGEEGGSRRKEEEARNLAAQRSVVIIIDDIQERTLATDLLLGYLSTLLTKRADLKLIFMSSTSLESEKFKEHFQEHYPSIHIMKVPGRLHPVEIVYTSDEEVDRNNYLDAVTKTVVNIHRHEPPGDVLVFLSEEGEVEDACNKISKEICNLKNLVGPMKLVPLYSCLPATMQHKIFEPCSGRKIVVTTNIVESSLSMDDISYVVDSGFVKKKVFDNKLNMECLVTSTISKASADMRSEHAGRTISGKCFRVYTEESYKNNRDQEICPEILRLRVCLI
ncbi:probable pre-mRNA-splicing factor ATP-dependent RNA helicase DEAH3 [Lathyrus oleraceus]|uniref:probable pre-mRNA-splicing factor ATP-dependent RNA helicase DEAH3 n=1 Tax=Pisum sativum TaxID=3888 RepID=UPI0021D26429|nr:probable pre-mRNA-splicing factor ATP-dependent RNA helicase DEAH3 [Pisum sativum]